MNPLALIPSLPPASAAWVFEGVDIFDFRKYQFKMKMKDCDAWQNREWMVVMLKDAWKCKL